ncbi:DUF2797 domain-containing protein [Streptomyces showdoensis]|uniref:DUF2797 domain-containing protein n=1 Tax=Streptomyces showdoensis TaxID=68268 RepID=A0A2P2GH79_STREW|nr:DUF2797 domain-containing protein [Streptomyces showdoensis]KKZ70145.1 hypothetical protein VO63_30580 [Streptomyces showdoensis]
MVWRSAGVSWRDGVPGLRWDGGRAGSRVSALGYGRVIGFRAVGERRCPGARGNVCPLGALVGGRSTGGRCAECARLDRAHSVAADTLLDDPRPYRVYLAWFGPGLVKVGITREERGDARLLEQGAVAFSWLGRGPLMAARRTEEVLRHALAVPDRIPYARKRAVRTALPPAAEREGEVAELYARAVGVGAWAETLERLECEVHDHVAAFRLDGLPPLDASVVELVPDGVVAGRLLAAAGPDLHLLDRDGRHLALDTRLLSGWGIESAPAGLPVSVPLGFGDGQEQLF